jgi:hypothetical protein
MSLVSVYDIVKLKNGSVAQVVSDGQDHGHYAKLDLDARLTVRFRDGRENRVKLREIATDPFSNEDKDTFTSGNPHLLP